MNQMFRQLLAEESDDMKLEALKNKYRALTGQAVGLWDNEEQKKFYAERERTYNQLLEYV